MEKTVLIKCVNNGISKNVPKGSSLAEIYDLFDLKMPYKPVCATVNNKIEGLHYNVYRSKDVEFLDLTTPSGHRTYTRSLFFVLCKAVHDLYPEGSVVIDIPVSKGYYCDLHIGCEVTPEVVKRIRQRMQEIIDAAMPIHRHEVHTDEAISLFRKLGTHSKVKLLETLGRIYTIYYDIDGYVDYFYGAMLTNTSELYLFDFVPYYDGALLRIPSMENPSVLDELTRQDKMFEVFKEHHRMQNVIGISTVGEFNEAVKNKNINNLMNVAEAIQEKKIAEIAFRIAVRINPKLIPEQFQEKLPASPVRLVLIAGPSSSGKTTTCKRLSIQLLTNGIRPVPISLDDYFVDRELTPRDETGDYDYESLYSLNIPLLNDHLSKLFAGEEIELPKYEFQTGKNVMSGKKLRLHDNEVLVLEGIHALNPELTAQIPEEIKFRVYASALTTILLDTHNYIPTTDNRLLRRIVRDAKYRGASAQDTLHRWASVRRGENKWIFPYQENADAMFNTAMIYELAVLRKHAEPLLEQVPENCKEYREAYRLLKFLKYFYPISDSALPPNSLLREFLGGSSFKY